LPITDPAISTAVHLATTLRKPLLVEKPLATTGEEARAVVRRLRTAGVPCLMAHTLRWNSVVRAVRERLAALGPLQALWLSQRFEPSPVGWLDDPAVSGGGMLLHTGVHSFDLVRHLTGHEIVRVWCRVARARTVRTEDNFMALLELDGAATLVGASGCRSTAGRSGLIDAAGTTGQLVADHQLGFAYAVRVSERTDLALPEPEPTVREALRSFARLILDDEPPPATLEDGAAAVLVAEACRRSAEGGGQPERVERLQP
jgi:predicted dehydrogenase